MEEVEGGREGTSNCAGSTKKAPTRARRGTSIVVQDMERRSKTLMCKMRKLAGEFRQLENDGHPLHFLLHVESDCRMCFASGSMEGLIRGGVWDKISNEAICGRWRVEGNAEEDAAFRKKIPTCASGVAQLSLTKKRSLLRAMGFDDIRRMIKDGKHIPEHMLEMLKNKENYFIKIDVAQTSQTQGQGDTDEEQRGSGSKRGSGSNAGQFSSLSSSEVERFMTFDAWEYFDEDEIPGLVSSDDKNMCLAFLVVQGEGRFKVDSCSNAEAVVAIRFVLEFCQQDYSSAVRPSRELQRMFNGVRHHGIFTGFGATSNTPKFTPTEQKIVSEAIFVNCGSMTMLCPDPQNGSRSTLLNASSPSERLKTPWLSFPDGRKQTQQGSQASSSVAAASSSSATNTSSTSGLGTGMDAGGSSSGGSTTELQGGGIMATVGNADVQGDTEAFSRFVTVRAATIEADSHTAKIRALSREWEGMDGDARRPFMDQANNCDAKDSGKKTSIKGVWECVVCESSGPGTMLHCHRGPEFAAAGCRVCDNCRFCADGEEQGAAVHRPHTCTHTSSDMSKCKTLGDSCMVLPDLGMGKEEWDGKGYMPPWGEGLWFSTRELGDRERLLKSVRDAQGRGIEPRRHIQTVYEEILREESQRRAERRSGVESKQSGQAQQANLLTSDLQPEREKGDKAGVDEVDGGGISSEMKQSTGGGGGGEKRKRDRRNDIKHGGAYNKEIRTFEHKWVYEDRFDSVRQWLLAQGAISSGDKEQDNNQFLARVIDIIHHSQYLHIGREAMGDKRDRAVRLPQSVFVDKSRGGGLCVMLHECIKYMRKKGYSADGFEKTMFKDEAEVHFEHMRLFEAIHSRLVNEHLIVYPSIYFHPDLGKALTKEQVQRYQNIATSHGAVVALDEEDATHIVVADTEGMAVDGDFCRTLALRKSNKKLDRDSFAYVHWWFFPDSYNEWLPKDDIQGNEPNEPEAERPNLKSVPFGPVTVCLRWLEDTQQFNEWMNEEDYEPEESQVVAAVEPSTVKSKTSGGKQQKLKSGSNLKAGETETVPRQGPRGRAGGGFRSGPRHSSRQNLNLKSSK